MFKNAGKKVLAALCSVALACMLVPMAAVSALAAQQAGETFTVGSVVYVVNAISPANVYVQGVTSTSAIGKVLTIPASVTSPEGVTYDVVGLQRECFKDCTNLQDIRLGDASSDIMIYPQAFDGCKNLQVIHCMGQARFSDPTHYSDDFDSCITDLKFVFHTGSWDFSDANTQGEGYDHSNGITYPKHTTG